MNAASIACIALVLVSISARVCAADAAAFSYSPSGSKGFVNGLTPEARTRESALNMAPTAPNAQPISDKTSQKAGKREELKVGYASLFGSITNDSGIPLCGLVLANGQFMFSCAPTGTYSLSNIPLDANNQITLFGFAEGHFPFKAVLSGSGGREDMTLVYAGAVGPPPPPPPPPPPSSSVITFTLADYCNDGYRIDFRFYDETNGLVWPSSTENYYTPGYGIPTSQNLSCNTGATVCYGGNTGSIFWGVGLNNNQSCSNCCISCQNGNSLSQNLTC